MKILSRFFKTEKSKKKKLKDVFEKNWYNPDLDSLLNTKNRTPVERLLNNISTTYYEMISNTYRAYIDISILDRNQNTFNRIYNDIYELNKIFSQSKECSNDLTLLILNISKICMITLGYINSIDGYDKEVKNINRIITSISEEFGDGNIDDIFLKRKSYSKDTIDYFVSSIYTLYSKVGVELNNTIVNNNKDYRKVAKTKSIYGKGMI